jgi:hypothetical protein
MAKDQYQAIAERLLKRLAKLDADLRDDHEPDADQQEASRVRLVAACIREDFGPPRVKLSGLVDHSEIAIHARHS